MARSGIVWHTVKRPTAALYLRTEQTANDGTYICSSPRATTVAIIETNADKLSQPAIGGHHGGNVQSRHRYGLIYQSGGGHYTGVNFGMFR